MAYDAVHNDEFEFGPLSNFTFRFFVDLEFIGTHQQYAGKIFQSTNFMPTGERPESSERHLSENTVITLFHTPKN